MDDSATATRVDKPWGHELIWALTDRYVGKILFIEAGKRLSLQYHEEKDESIFVLEGRMVLHLEDSEGELQSIEMEHGDSHRIPVGARHRFAAIEDTRLVEVSSPEIEDVVRVEDDFGREGTTEA
ncbi:MAG: cupin domain-containing protein [Acidimicrobiia bacterium]